MSNVEARRVGGDASASSFERLIDSLRSALSYPDDSNKKKAVTPREEAVLVASSLVRASGAEHVFVTIRGQQHVHIRYKRGSLASLEGEGGRVRCLCWSSAPGEPSNTMPHIDLDTERNIETETWTWASKHVFCDPEVLKVAYQALINRKHVEKVLKDLTEDSDQACHVLRAALTQRFGSQWSVVSMEIPKRQRGKASLGMAGIVTASSGTAFSMKSDKIAVFAWQQSLLSEQAKRLIGLTKMVGIMAAMVLVIIVAGMPRELRDNFLQYSAPTLAFVYLLYKMVWKHRAKGVTRVLLYINEDSKGGVA